MELREELYIRELGKMLYEYCRLAHVDCEKAVGAKAMEALQKIKALIEDDNLTDFDCIEAIVQVFEGIGSDGGGRHDF